MTPITSLEAFLVIAIPVVLVVVSFWFGLITGRSEKSWKR